VDKTRIPWSDMTWNPLAGCSPDPMSPGCINCYAKGMARRMGGPGQHFDGLATKEGWTGDVGFFPHILAKPIGMTKPRVIFIGSMGDLFYSGVGDHLIDEVMGVVAACMVGRGRSHLFLALTKRPERMLDYMTTEGVQRRWADAIAPRLENGDWFGDQISMIKEPLKNLWLGTSTEDQERYNKRIGYLIETPAAGRFISVEPMLSKISMMLGPPLDLKNGALSWVICGGESGPNARPLHLEWARRLQGDCMALGIPFMFKQYGTWEPAHWYTEATHAVRESDGRLMKLHHEPKSASRADGPPDGWCGLVKVRKKRELPELNGRIHADRPFFDESRDGEFKIGWL